MSADFPDGPGTADPSLDGLLRALTADGSADELAARQAALTLFRRSRRRPRRRPPFPVGAAAAAVLVAGGIAAAYAAVLPAPVQHIAFRMLDGIGVPDAHHRPPSPGAPPVASSIPSTTSNTAVSAAPTATAAPAPACPCHSVTPGPNAPPALVLAASRARITAGGGDDLSGRLAPGGRAEPGVGVWLFERVAGRRGWQVAGSAITDRYGDVRLTIRNLTGNASFRLTAPGSPPSLPVLITVIPRVYLDLAAGEAPGADTLTATAPFANAGDVVVLQERSDGKWHSVREHKLGRDHLTSFTVKVPGSGGGLEYRVVLPATITHGWSASGRVQVAALVTRSSRPHSQAGHELTTTSRRVLR
ncbi:MAG TPA: hypothetical protein VME19_13950 [Streptosporangiaceae bacterium]|nr:hypothetical protein [Streptosporangiaceae bacterium]